MGFVSGGEAYSLEFKEIYRYTQGSVDAEALLICCYAWKPGIAVPQGSLDAPLYGCGTASYLYHSVFSFRHSLVLHVYPIPFDLFLTWRQALATVKNQAL